MSKRVNDRYLAVIYGPGHITMCECPMCGHLEYKSTDMKQPDGFTHTHDTSICKRCVHIAKQAPEFFDWVIAVVSKSKDL